MQRRCFLLIILSAAVVFAAPDTGSGEKDAAMLQKIAALSGKPDGAAELVRILDDFQRTVHQCAAVAALAHFTDQETARAVLARWRSIKPGARAGVVQLLVAQPAWRRELLAALKRGDLLPAELGLNAAQRAVLLDENDADLATGFAAFFHRQDFEGRKKLVDAVLAELPEEGNLREGNELYRQRCLICHRHGRLGNDVGPDLTRVAERSEEDLITNVVDPNLIINPSFITCEITRKNGSKVIGILAEETPESVTLVKALALREVVPWQEIALFKTARQSLMPEGLESSLAPVDFRSLVQFLQSADPPSE